MKLKTIDKVALEFLCNLVGEEFPFLNSGGCGVFAYIMGYMFQDDDIKFSVKVLNTYGHNMDCNNKPEDKKDYRNWNSEGIYFSHIFLEVDNGNGTFWLDNSNCLIWSGSFIMKGALSLDDIEPLVKKISRMEQHV